MKKMIALLAAALTLTAVLTACGQKQESRTPEELTQVYADALTENGGEMVEYNPVISKVDSEDPVSAMILESMGLKEEDMTAFGVSGSMMNVKAYGIAAVMPAEGKEEAVKEGLQGFIDRQKSSFETYLADQYAVAESARAWRPWRTAPSSWSCARTRTPSLTASAPPSRRNPFLQEKIPDCLAVRDFFILVSAGPLRPNRCLPRPR